jgi:hypothetical protein
VSGFYAVFRWSVQDGTTMRGKLISTILFLFALPRAASTEPLYFPHWVDGGYTTRIMLLNTGSATQTAKLSFFADDGSPVAVNRVGGTCDTTFAYTIPPADTIIFRTDGLPASAIVGSVEVIPDRGTSSSVGSGILATVTGRYLVITRFQPDERAVDPMFVDTVPRAVCSVGDSFLVSFLSATPYPAGASSVRLWNPSDGGWARLSLLVGDLTMTNDMICLRGATLRAPRLVTVELSQNFFSTQPSGRLQLINGSEKRVLMRNVLLPVRVAQHPVSTDLFVATLTGSIFRMSLP